MKQLVLSEGVHDVLLVECFYESEFPSSELKPVYAEELEFDDLTDLQGQETKKIKNFLQRFNPYDVLVKSENGKPNLIQVFVKTVNFLASKPLELCLLIDLDGGSMSSLLATLDKKARGTYKSADLRISQSESIHSNEHMEVVEAELHDGNRVRDNFRITAFTDSFETAAKIDKQTDSKDVMRSKAETFLNDYPSVRHGFRESF
jgi:hypothetical protein